MTSLPLVLAHRGACRVAPENTLAAFRAARDLGAHGAEIDVRRTADGVLVVHHDPKREDVGLLCDRTFAELRALAPEIPTLDEALDELEGLVVDVELKCLPWEDDHDAEHSMVDPVAACVRRREMAERVVVSSFDLEAVNAVRAAAPKIPTGWLTMGKDPHESLRVVADLGHRWLHPDRAAVLELDDLSALVAEAESFGVRLDVWTVNEPHELVALATAGVHALITDVPDVARAALAGESTDEP